MIREWLPVCALILVLSGQIALAAGVQVIPTGKGLSAVGQVAFPPVALRGYGTLSGTQWTFTVAGKAAAILRLQCEDVEKAKVVHAKYLSDLVLMPGVTQQSIPTPAGAIAGYAVEQQGMVAAARTGNEVVIFSGDNGTLDTLYSAGIGGDRKTLVFTPEVEVPMYLDRWDRFGFRFYYREWEIPKGMTTETYDFRQEFAYAQKMDRAGFLFWDKTCSLDRAEGLMNGPIFDWAARQARAMKLPVAINLSGTMQSWLANRYRDEITQKMPGFVGGFRHAGDPHTAGQEVISWNATTAKDVQLAELQQSVRRFHADENVVNWLEPHGELEHDKVDILLEYGPVADKNFRRYLQEKYTSLETVSLRWTGNAKQFTSWDDVRVPELASFLGWRNDAIDLTGTWRIFFAPEGHKEPFAHEMLQPGFDDRNWATIQAPGHDHALFLPKSPAVYRRSFTVTPAWKAAHPRAWLYVWDLNYTPKEVVIATLNGREVGRSTIKSKFANWAAYEVSDALVAGNNALSLVLPQGFLGYRVYLSGDAPKQYPDLGAQLNARWVDYAGFTQWSRTGTLRRGLEMIRQVDPNRPITLMAPDAYFGEVLQLAEAYGGIFHNTGYMGATWADFHTMLTNGADLPYDLEPGSPAADLNEFKKFIGLYSTEGIQGIDYFIHIGSILWEPEIRKHFEENQAIIRLIGKYHQPKAETAILFSERTPRLTGYPWGFDPNTNLVGGYWNFNVGQYLLPYVPRDGVTEASFRQGGNAAKYKVIIDSNTSILDEEQVQGIEQFVRNGGIFCTFVQTGRHSPTEPNSWPISRLTGYKVTHIDGVKSNGATEAWRPVTPAPGQTIFPADQWKDVKGNGLSLEKVAPDCQDLMYWSDGTVAAGIRPLGKGFIIQSGVKFCHNKISWDNTAVTTKYFLEILDWAKVRRLPATVEPLNVITRYYISNNGLYDIWAMWNQTKQPQTAALTFRADAAPETLLDINTKNTLTVTRDAHGARLGGLLFEPQQTRIFIAPRKQLAQAPADWFTLQRNWWRGTTPPSATPLPKLEMKFACDLTDDWAFKPMTDTDDATMLAAPATSTTGWERVRLGIWNLPDHQDVHHALLRKTFTVPASWSNGRVELWLQSWVGVTFMDRGRVFLDGKLARDFDSAGLAGALQPGSTHVLTVEVIGKGVLQGVRGNAWLYYIPNPQSSIDLAGRWTMSNDAVHFTNDQQLPGAWDGRIAKRMVMVDKAYAGKNVVIHLDGDETLAGVIINGRWVRRHHHLIGRQFDLNITPWIKFGEANEIEVVSKAPMRITVRDISLRIYTKDMYP